MPRALSAPVRLGVGRGHLVGAQAALEIDSGAAEYREPGSDLAIGHAHILPMATCAQCKWSAAYADLPTRTAGGRPMTTETQTE